MSLSFDLSISRNDFHLAATCRMEGRVWGLLGPSGAGKTSLLHGLAGLIDARGHIEIDGHCLLDSKSSLVVPPHKRRIGYVFQDNRLLPHKSVLGNLRYAQRRVPPNVTPIEFDKIVTFLELAPLLKRSVHHLSGGEQRRVAVARALAQSPRLLLLDEPMAGLDDGRKDRMLSLLQQIAHQSNIAMLLVSHDLADLLALTDQLAFLDKGRILAAGTYQSIQQQGHLFSSAGWPGRKPDSKPEAQCILSQEWQTNRADSCAPSCLDRSAPIGVRDPAPE